MGVKPPVFLNLNAQIHRPFGDRTIVGFMQRDYIIFVYMVNFSTFYIYLAIIMNKISRFMHTTMLKPCNCGGKCLGVLKIIADFSVPDFKET